MKKPILHLNLTKKWFEEIAFHGKREEYRELKPYWHRFFSGGHIKIKGKYYHPTDVVVCFSNGYKKVRPQIFFQINNLRVKEGRPEWGAEPGKQYYTICLGARIQNQEL